MPVTRQKDALVGHRSSKCRCRICRVIVSRAGCPFIDIHSSTDGCESCLCWGHSFRGTVDLSVGLTAGTRKPKRLYIWDLGHTICEYLTEVSEFCYPALQHLMFNPPEGALMTTCRAPPSGGHPSALQGQLVVGSQVPEVCVLTSCRALTAGRKW